MSAALSAAPGPRVRVMLCDDSAVIRSALGRILGEDPAVEVVARAVNGRDALDQVSRRPDLADVLLLDIEMPVMDGLSALPLLLKASPRLRVIMASTLSTRGATVTLEALRLGAADYVPKPEAAALAGDGAFRRELLGKVRALGRRGAPVQGTVPVALRPGFAAAPMLLAIGSSTGGPQALATLLPALKQAAGPGGLGVPVVITQHMPPAFTALLAGQLARQSGLPCSEAADGVRLEAGHLYLAPGGRHLVVRRVAGVGREAGLEARLEDGPPENYCRPSVDPMLRSATEACSGRALLVMLTGMGQDGLEGTRALVGAGGVALAQDEATSVVWGMPGAVARAGLCHAVLPLEALAERTARLLRGGR